MREHGGSIGDYVSTRARGMGDSICLRLDVHMRRKSLATHVAGVRARRTLCVVRIQHARTQILAVRKARDLAWRRP
jgi:hypothetical protein